MSGTTQPGIWFSPYQLRPRRRLGSHAFAGPRSGALLRVEYPRIGVGYADCHPWEELGDAPLQVQLKGVAQGRLTPLTRNSLQFSRLDAEARSQRRSLFEGMTVPRSHFLLTDLSDEALDEAAQALAEGFDRIKLKLGRDWKEKLPLLRRLFDSAIPRARIRLDLNSSLDSESLETLLATLEGVADFIDFIEDPLPWDDSTGFGPIASRWRVALDRGSGAFLRVEDAALERIFPPVLVVKPAVDDWQGVLTGASACRARLVITSYLDHPLGQLSAAYVAARAATQNPARIDRCGLVSHTAYETNPFSLALRHKEGRLEADRGPGLGMDELLEKSTTWKPLESIG